jgi:lipopolysaccharide transport system permease protein
MNDAKELPVVIFSPESQMRTPVRLFRNIWQDIISSRELAWRLFVRDLSAKYRQSILGVFWAFVPPIMVGLIFIVLHSKKIVDFGETEIPYPVFALIGTTLWQLFTESLNAPLLSVKSAKPILAKIKFPYEALLLSAFYSVLFKFFIKSLVLAGILIVFQVKVTPGLLLAPVAILALILLGMTIGLFLTPLGMLYTDIPSALPVITQLWFFLTPVVYPPPTSFPFSLITILNPVSPILVSARDFITKGYITNFQPFLIIGLLTIVGLLIALIAYRISLPIIIERMSA